MNKNILILLYIIIFLYCCKTEGPNLPVPDAVMMVPKFPDTSAVELGIDAIPEYDGILLQWYRSNDRNIEYYNI